MGEGQVREKKNRFPLDIAAEWSWRISQSQYHRERSQWKQDQREQRQKEQDQVVILRKMDTRMRL